MAPSQLNDVVHYRFKKKPVFVVSRSMTLPNGLKVEKELVLHPGAALIVPFLTSQKLIILRQYRSTINRYLYEFPAGTLEFGEAPVRCARRELMEEAGYRAGRLLRKGMIYPVPGYSDEKIYIYSAYDLKPFKKVGDADEVLEPVVLDRASLRRLFFSGRIIDGKTIAALAFCGILK